MSARKKPMRTSKNVEGKTMEKKDSTGESIRLILYQLHVNILGVLVTYPFTKKSMGLYSDAHFLWFPVTDRLKSPKSDSSNPPQDLGPIKTQFWWSHVQLHF